jgi:hypothetical protein
MSEQIVDSVRSKYGAVAESTLSHNRGCSDCRRSIRVQSDIRLCP